jgi:non-canonical poly(A) RNA polymerase PAPD5/7
MPRSELLEARTRSCTCLKGESCAIRQGKAKLTMSLSRDIDLVVISPKMDLQRTESVLRSMAVCLRRNNLATDVQVIGRAKVPIIKFVCTHGKYKVDISINHTNGIDASQFVADWLRRCPALRPIIMATKLLLSQRGMSEVFSGGLGSYSVICMVISFIQMHPKIQRGEIDPSRNLGVLFIEFLELYGKNFGYDEVGISIRGGGSYFRKVARGWKDDRCPFKLSIEDPGDTSNDIAKGSFSILNVRQTYGGAFDIMTAVMCQRATSKEEASRKRRKGNKGHRDEDEEAREALLNSARLGESDKDPDSLLGNIIGVNREMIKARRDIDALWESGTLQYLLGRSPPPRDPVPHKSSRPSYQEERRAPRAADDERRPPKEVNGKGPARAPRAMLAEERKSRAEVNGNAGGKSREREEDHRKGSKIANTKQGTASGSKGTSNDPVIVLDSSSSDSHLQRKSKGDLKSSTLRLDEADSPHSVRDDEEGNDLEADSKYATHQQDNKRKKKASRLDEFAKTAPKTFIIVDSASEDDYGDGVSDEGEGAAPKRQKTSSKEDEERRRKRKEYWESKGNAATTISSDEGSS